MRMIDANLLVYAHVESFEQHVGALSWLDGLLNGVERVGLPWPSLLGFVRLVTNPRIFERPETLRLAWEQVNAWLDAGATWIPLPTERHLQILDGFFAGSSLRANLVPDAHLAALAIEHGLLLCSTDGDFARFSGLRWQNPIASE